MQKIRYNIFSYIIIFLLIVFSFSACNKATTIEENKNVNAVGRVYIIENPITHLHFAVNDSGKVILREYNKEEELTAVYDRKLKKELLVCKRIYGEERFEEEMSDGEGNWGGYVGSNYYYYYDSDGNIIEDIDKSWRYICCYNQKVVFEKQVENSSSKYLYDINTKEIKDYNENFADYFVYEDNLYGRIFNYQDDSGRNVRIYLLDNDMTRIKEVDDIDEDWSKEEKKYKDMKFYICRNRCEKYYIRNENGEVISKKYHGLEIENSNCDKFDDIIFKESYNGKTKYFTLNKDLYECDWDVSISFYAYNDGYYAIRGSDNDWLLYNVRSDKVLIKIDKDIKDFKYGEDNPFLLSLIYAAYQKNGIDYCIVKYVTADGVWQRCRVYSSDGKEPRHYASFLNGDDNEAKTYKDFKIVRTSKSGGGSYVHVLNEKDEIMKILDFDYTLVVASVDDKPIYIFRKYWDWDNGNDIYDIYDENFELKYANVKAVKKVGNTLFFGKINADKNYMDEHFNDYKSNMKYLDYYVINGDFEPIIKRNTNFSNYFIFEFNDKKFYADEYYIGDKKSIDIYDENFELKYKNAASYWLEDEWDKIFITDDKKTYVYDEYFVLQKEFDFVMGQEFVFDRIAGKTKYQIFINKDEGGLKGIIDEDLNIICNNYKTVKIVGDSDDKKYYYQNGFNLYLSDFDGNIIFKENVFDHMSDEEVSDGSYY